MTSPEVLMPATVPEAHDFFQNAYDQIGRHLIQGEREAKLGAIVAMASGLNVVFFGAPGGGKTTLGEHLPRLVEDLNFNDHIAVIPPQADLTPQMLVGGEVKTTKEVTKGGETYTESLITKIDNPILHALVRVIWANEINRTNQYAMNTGLEAYEAGKVDHVGGRVQLDLLWSASTMNPEDKRDGTFPISPATASRHAIGVNMGAGSPEERQRITTKILQGWEPTPEEIRPVTDIETLKRIRALTEAPDKISSPEQLLGFANELVDTTQLALKQVGISETNNRIAKHIRKISRTISALMGSEIVDQDGLGWAARYVAGARLGMHRTDLQTTAGILDSIYKAPGS